MIKNLLSIAFVCSAFIANAQSFSLSYPFTAVTPTTGLIDPTPTPTAVGVTSGSFTAVGTPSANANASGRFSFVGWPTGSLTGTVSTDVYANMTGTINTAEYYEITLTPQSGYTVTLNSMAFTVQRSGTGIRNYSVRTSADGYTNNLPAAVVTNTNLSVVGTNEFFWNLDAITGAQNGSTINLFGATITTATSFRFYGWNSEAAGGTFSIDNVLIDGSASDGTVPCASPTITAITGNSAICVGQPLNLGSTLLGDAPFTYTWTGAGTLATPNASNTSVTSATSSDYTLTVENACGTATSVVTATVNALPTVSVTSAAICAGNSATLSATGTASSYGWSTGDNTPSIVVTPTTSPVDYTVTGTDANNCSNTAIATVTVNAGPNVSLTLNPDLHCVTVNSVTLVGGTPTGGTYSGSGVTGGVFSPATVGIGSYTITYSVTDGNNCTAVNSDIMTVDACTGIQTLDAELFTVYPNPTNGLVIVKTPGLNAQVNVFDINGKKVFTQTTTSFETQIDLSHLANGVYQLNIVSDNQSLNYKMMMNK